MTEFLLLNAATLDIASWPLQKNDSQDLSCFFFLNDTEVWLAQG